MANENKNTPCPAREELSAYLDGDLPDRRAAEIRTHVLACSACQQEEAALRALTYGLAALAEVNPTRDLWSALEHRRVRNPRLSGFFRGVALTPRRLAVAAAAFASQKEHLAPQAFETIQKGLAEIEQVVEPCRQAIRANPASLEPRRVMLAAYQQKVDLLTEVLSGPQDTR